MPQAAPVAGHRACNHPHANELSVQRHSSWEHSLLGDAKPDVLAKIGTWTDLISQTERTGLLRRRKTKTATVILPQIGPVDKGQVLHVLVQELSRLKKWQSNPPEEASTENPFSKTGMDPTYDVMTVRLPAEDPKKSMLITYGELNTLADFYGNLEAMKSANPKQRRQIVQSVREETFVNLSGIYDKLQSSLTKREGKGAGAKAAKRQHRDEKLGSAKFSGATKALISGKAGQLELIFGIQGIGNEGAENKYKAGLARNACHFVPESWHAWASYHDQARVVANDAYQLGVKAGLLRGALQGVDFSQRAGDLDQANADIAAVKRERSEKANEALLNNGFGDHYLQDSYASGHMINKT
ncbi:MAG: hypothetical protein ACRDX8_02395, partial [Acidimicrobiales bacterium]